MNFYPHSRIAVAPQACYLPPAFSAWKPALLVHVQLEACWLMKVYEVQLQAIAAGKNSPPAFVPE